MSRDQPLFESLHKQYHAMVSQMCLGFMKGDQEQADDLSQDVFINIWNALDNFRGASSYKTWIYRITVNTCLQHIRKEKKMPKSPIADASRVIADNGHRTGEFDELYRAIAQLSDVDRLIIMMVLDELEYEEISKVVGISAVNVRVRIHRIKERLKKIMEYESRN